MTSRKADHMQQMSLFIDRRDSVTFQDNLIKYKLLQLQDQWEEEHGDNLLRSTTNSLPKSIKKNLYPWQECFLSLGYKLAVGIGTVNNLAPYVSLTFGLKGRSHKS